MKIKDVKKIFSEATDEQIQQMMDAVHEETDSLRDQIQNMQKKADPEGWKNKYEDLKTEHDKLKNDIAKEKTDAEKKTALKELLKDDFSEKGLEKALKYADLDSIELDAKGNIKGASALLTSMKEEWSDYVTTEETKGAETSGKDGGTGGAGGSGSGKQKMTREEIMKISDDTARQKAIMENPEAFQ